MGQDLQGSVALLQDFSVSTPRDISSIALGKSRGGRVLDLIRRAECLERVGRGLGRGVHEQDGSEAPFGIRSSNVQITVTNNGRSTGPSIGIV